MPDATTPTPSASEVAGKLQEIETRLNTLRALGDAGKDFEFRDQGGVDAILALTAEKMALRGDPVEPVAAQESGPKLSSDPAEAAIGLREPEAPDERAIEQRLEYLGADVKAWPAEARALSREVSALATPAGLVDDAVNLIRDFHGMASTAREQQWSEELAHTELERRHGAAGAERIVELATIVWDELGNRARKALLDDRLNTYPDAVEALAQIAEKLLATDAGVRITLRRSAAALAARDRGES